uniref:Venom S1 protease 25 n=1 Tax=Oncocephalus sp. TaxID=2944721 RepID=A0AB38ZEM9_9HEMI
MLKYGLIGVTVTVLATLTICKPIDPQDSSEHGVTQGQLKNNCTCGWVNRSPQRIIGGEETGVNEWPMMAALIRREIMGIKNMFFCGGSILTTRHVLTAGHCIHDEQGRPFSEHEIGVVLGAHKLSKVNYNDPKVMRTPEKLIKHPNYVWPITQDIAIIILPTIQFSQIIGPVCLPTEWHDLEDKKLKVTGWGYTSPSGPPSDVLKKTDLIGYNHGVCGKKYIGTVLGAVFDLKNVYQICTSQPATSQCRGDSGGPIMRLNKQTNRYEQVGVVSYGHPRCRDYPAVSSSVHYFTPWIQHVISTTFPEEKTCAKQSA